LLAGREDARFFTINSPDAPEWAVRPASFQKEGVLRHAEIIRGIESMIAEVAVNCIPSTPVSNTCRELDLLQIDTDGADPLVLSMVPFERIEPSLVHWDIKHLSVREREDSLSAMTNQGYRVATSGNQDMMALLF
jgi:hypothetical protein